MIFKIIFCIQSFLASIDRRYFAVRFGIGFVHLFAQFFLQGRVVLIVPEHENDCENNHDVHRDDQPVFTCGAENVLCGHALHIAYGTFQAVLHFVCIFCDC